MSPGSTFPNRTTTVSTVGIGQNQYSDWYGWFSYSYTTAFDGLLGIEPNSEYLRDLVPQGSSRPTFETSVTNSDSPTLPSLPAPPTIIAQGIRGEITNDFAGIVEDAEETAETTLSASYSSAQVGLGEAILNRLVEEWQAAFSAMAGDAETRVKAIMSDKEAFSAAAWRGMRRVATLNNIPTIMLDAVAPQYGLDSYQDNNRISETTTTFFLNRWIYLSKTDLRVYARIALFPNSGVVPDVDAGGRLATAYNEVFHAFMSLQTWSASRRWIVSIMQSQQQFGPLYGYSVNELKWGSRYSKAEEASSELVNRVVLTLAEGGMVLTYDKALTNAAWHRDLTPGHPNQWQNDPTIDEPMSETLFYATIWVLYNGTKDPFPERGTMEMFVPGYGPATFPILGDGIPGQLEELKRFFARKFRPQWSPDDVERFAEGKWDGEST